MLLKSMAGIKKKVKFRCESGANRFVVDYSIRIVNASNTCLILGYQILCDYHLYVVFLGYSITILNIQLEVE